MIWFFVWIACGLFAGSIAQTKGYSGCLWLIIGFMFGPLALLGIGFMEKKAPQIDGPASENTRPCPHCAEQIKLEAVKCRFCFSEVRPLR